MKNTGKICMVNGALAHVYKNIFGKRYYYLNGIFYSIKEIRKSGLKTSPDRTARV